jgi:hypothetical protein
MSNKIHYFPTAIYGKAISAGKVPEGYRWLYSPNEFPAVAFDMADRFAKSFQWISKARRERYKPVTCLLPLSHTEAGALLLLFLDEGDDDRGRPHMLYMKAAYIKQEYFHENPDILIALLCADYSQSPVLAGQNSDSWETSDELYLHDYREALKKENINLSRHAVLVTSETDIFLLKPPVPVKVLEQKTLSLINEISSVQQNRIVANEINIKKEYSQTESGIPQKRIMNKIPTRLSIALNIILIASLAYVYWNKSEEIKDNKDIIANLRVEKENLEKEKTGFDDTINELRREIEKLQKENQSSKTIINEKENEIKDYESRIKDYQKNVDQATKNELDKIKEKYQVLEKWKDKVIDYFNKFENLIEEQNLLQEKNTNSDKNNSSNSTNKSSQTEDGRL